jgi:hypothetical protein
MAAYYAQSLTQFSDGDSEVSLDTNAADCYAGSACAHISAGDTGQNERLYHALSLTPNREYHLSMMIKEVNVTQDPANPWYPNIEIAETDPTSGQTIGLRLSAPFPSSDTNGWVQYDYVFNSKGITTSTLIMGIWGGILTGDIWIDNVSLEEIGLWGVVRRAGTPLKLYDPSSGKTFTEGTDFQPISDPTFLSLNGNIAYDSGGGTHYHTPPAVAINPSATGPQLGETIAIDYSGAVPFYDDTYCQSWACMTEPGVMTFNQQWAQALSQLFPPDVGYFMSYDEFRQEHTCENCKSQFATAGELLASHATQMTNMLVGQSGVRPGAPIYVWSDMFDEHHNAGITDYNYTGTRDYYYTDDTISGSWAGLPSYVTIFNWHSPAAEAGDPQGNLGDSLRFFAGITPDNPTPHAQIISGFYDCGCDGNARAQMEMSYAAGVPGLQGMMYTTWAGDYSQLQNYAQGVLAAWPAYKASVSP